VLEKSTYYILDAQGNTIATYERAIEAGSGTITFAQKEKFVYGSSRLGVHNDDIALYGSQNATYSQATWTHTIGKRNYELSNHLGNVLSVISDKPMPVDDAADGDVDWFLADIRQSTDYSAFGVQLNGRTLTKSGLSKKYKRGYQGSEMDNEVKGEGNSYTTEFRQLDPRLGRWLTLDPVIQPWQSPYCSMDNNPIWFNDVKGDRVKIEREEGISNKEFRQFKRDIRHLRRNSETYNAMYTDLQNDKETYTFRLVKELPGGGGSYDKTTRTLEFQSGISTTYDCDSKVEHTRLGILAHETGHAWRHLHNLDPQNPTINTAIVNEPPRKLTSLRSTEEYPSAQFSDYLVREAEYTRTVETEAMHIENIVRSELKKGKYSDMSLRQFYLNGKTTKLVTSNFGNVRFDMDSVDYDVLVAPRTREYYETTDHDLYKEFKVEPIK
jgi:RHS repeat-associated protein